MPFSFDNSSFLSLMKAEHSELLWLEESLQKDERPLLSFKSVRDAVSFTNLRLILRNQQGLTGKKIALSTVPYDSITSYTIETAGAMDISVLLTLFVREAGELKLELIRDTDVKILDGLLSRAILQRGK